MSGHKHYSTNHGDWAQPGIIERLGTVPDSVIAAEVGVTRQRVAQVRERLGIRSSRSRGYPQEMIDLLGYQPDLEIARAFGVCGNTVSELRRKLGIARYRAPHGTPARYNTGCRCANCKEANAIRRRNYITEHPEAVTRARDKLQKKVLASAPHAVGKISWYSLGCRCDGCKKANSDYWTPEAIEKRTKRRQEREQRVQARVDAVAAEAVAI
jgi:hypothetical protein